MCAVEVTSHSSSRTTTVDPGAMLSAPASAGLVLMSTGLNLAALG